MSSGNKQKIVLTKKIQIICVFSTFLTVELEASSWIFGGLYSEHASWLWQCSPTVGISFHGLMATTTQPSSLNFVTQSIKKSPNSRVTDNRHNLSPQNRGCFTIHWFWTNLKVSTRLYKGNLDLFSFCYYSVAVFEPRSSSRTMPMLKVAPPKPLIILWVLLQSPFADECSSLAFPSKKLFTTEVSFPNNLVLNLRFQSGGPPHTYLPMHTLYYRWKFQCVGRWAEIQASVVFYSFYWAIRFLSSLIDWGGTEAVFFRNRTLLKLFEFLVMSPDWCLYKRRSIVDVYGSNRPVCSNSICVCVCVVITLLLWFCLMGMCLGSLMVVGSTLFCWFSGIHWLNFMS